MGKHSYQANEAQHTIVASVGHKGNVLPSGLLATDLLQAGLLIKQCLYSSQRDLLTIIHLWKSTSRVHTITITYYEVTFFMLLLKYCLCTLTYYFDTMFI